jgi:hypothetical protein
LMRNIATGHGAVVTFNLIWFEYSAFLILKLWVLHKIQKP